MDVNTIKDAKLKVQKGDIVSPTKTSFVKGP